MKLTPSFKKKLFFHTRACSGQNKLDFLDQYADECDYCCFQKEGVCTLNDHTYLNLTRTGRFLVWLGIMQ